MPYTLRLYFSGLCFFDLVDGTPSDPERANVLLVNAVDKTLRYPGVKADDVCEHRPRLVARLRNVSDDSTREPSEVRPGPDGEDLALYDIRGAVMKLESAKAPVDRDLSVRRLNVADLPDVPADKAQEAWFDWTAPVRKLHDTILGLHPDASRPGSRVTSILNLDDGELRTMEVGRQYGQMLRFEYKSYGGTTGPVYSKHAMTDRVELEIKTLTDAVTLEFDDGTAVELWAPDQSLLTVSITNLCDEAKPKNISELTDFLWFYNLFAWNGSPPRADDLIIPVVDTAYGAGSVISTPSTGSCPPATSG